MDEVVVEPERVRAVYLFADLDEVQFARVMADVRALSVLRAEALFAQGQPAERFYLLLSGQIKLYRLSAGGNEKVIEIIQPGQTFAEALIFLPDNRYPIHADALEDAALLSFSHALFKNLLHESVDTCFRLMGLMSMRLHHHVNEIERLTLHNATHRLVSYLLRQDASVCDGGAQVYLPASKHTVASHLSIQPETLSRILARLTTQGLMRVQGTHITLLDLEALRHLADTP